MSLRYTYGVEQQPQRIPLLNARDYITLSRSNIAKFNQADLTYNGKEDQAKFLSGSFGMSTGNPRNSKNTLEFLDVYLQKYGQGYVSNLLENEGWQTMADPVTGKQLIFQDNDFQKATFTTGQKHAFPSRKGPTSRLSYSVPYKQPPVPPCRQKKKQEPYLSKGVPSRHISRRYPSFLPTWFP